MNGAAAAPGILVNAPVIVGANGEVYPASGWGLASGPRLAFTLDDSKLPPEAFPYVIDPTTTLQPDSAGLDARIVQHAPDTNYGTTASAYVGDGNGSSNNRGRFCIEFDVSSIDSAEIVSSAISSLYEFSANDAASVSSWAVNLHRVRRAWVEAEVTYNDYSSGNAWSTAGADDTDEDIFPTVSAAHTFDGTAAVAQVDWPTGANIVSDVQGFVDGGLANNGWLLKAPDAEDQGASTAQNDFRTSDTSTEAERPKLVVVHATPATFIPKVIVL